VRCAFLLIICLTAGCRSEQNAKADNKVLWDSNGCAFYVRPNVGDNSFIRPLPDANKPTCTTTREPSNG